MSYILKQSNPFISVKLTEVGRQKLASGQLNFSKWALGDSEIDYRYMSPNPPSVDAKILRPKDRNPNIKSYLRASDNTYLKTLTSAEINLLGITVNNRAEERGFFEAQSTGTTTGWTVLTSSTYVSNTGFVDISYFTGGTTVDLPITGLTNCDLIQFAFTNPILGGLTPNETNEATQWLWYGVKGQTGNTVTLDRSLPDIVGFYAGSSGINVQYFIYTNCNDANGCYTSGCTTAYWNTGTLEFNSSCDISITDVPIWCQNNVWCEELAGLSATTYQGYKQFGSIDYIGQKQYLGYPCECTSATSINICTDQSSVVDDVNKVIGIFHYTNNSISNFYGEFFYIDTTANKVLKVDFPTLMWHRRSGFSGSTTGTYMGMSFVSTGDVKTVELSDIEYYDLIEEPTMSITPSNPLVVGRVYPQLKIVTIHNEEIVAALSYKSNRNWTLPSLKAFLSNPSTGVGTGVLQPNQTMYLTYQFDTDSGFTSTMPCQHYAKIVNTTSANKDVQFTIEDIGLLPYMKQVESITYDGRGFYAHNFNLLVQIVEDPDCRPSPTKWKQITWGGLSGQTIDPLTLEDQNPIINDFVVTNTRYTAATDFNLSYLGLPLVSDTEILNFGDERFMYGNLNTWIGAKIYKTIFNFNVDASLFSNTTNPTKDTATNLYFNEVGIYDTSGDLVIISKFSTPIELPSNTTVGIELTLDF
jgi:hypothetical protein